MSVAQQVSSGSVFGTNPRFSFPGDQLCFAKQAGIISYKSYVIRQIDFKTAFYLISTLRAGPCLSPNNIALYVEIRYWKSRVQKIVASGMNFACPVITWLLASSAKGELKRCLQPSRLLLHSQCMIHITETLLNNVSGRTWNCRSSHRSSVRANPRNILLEEKNINSSYCATGKNRTFAQSHLFLKQTVAMTKRQQTVFFNWAIDTFSIKDCFVKVTSSFLEKNKFHVSCKRFSKIYWQRDTQ